MAIHARSLHELLRNPLNYGSPWKSSSPHPGAGTVAGRGTRKAPASAACAWLGIILIGVGHGGLFPLVPAVPVSASRDADHARRLSGMAFFIGYACAAAAPLLVGWLRDVNGNFHLTFALLAATALAITWPIARPSPRRLAAMRASDPMS
jgi:cyanate permease